jgi:hypothetical protein
LNYQNNYSFFSSELVNCLNESELIKEGLIKSNINLSNLEENSETNKSKRNIENMMIKENEDVSNLGKESDGSDSEPSADNIDKEELLKLLPSQAKKKIKVKKKKTVLYMKPVKPKIEEKDKNDNLNKDKQIKSFVTSNISKDSALVKETHNILKVEKASLNIRTVLINSSFDKDKVFPLDSKKKDQETQTEEVFFKK